MGSLTVGKLLTELAYYPKDWEVMIEVRGQEAFATDVDMESGGVSAWVKIHDYPTEEE